MANDADFGQTTDEAVKDAIHGQTRIFADGMKTLTAANAANNAEYTRWKQIRDMAQSYMDSIQGTIQENVTKVEQYNKTVKETAPKVDLTATDGPISVTVGV